MKIDNNLKQDVFIGILCAQGIVLGIIERSLPSPLLFAPGAKLGLTNIISVIALVTLPFKDCILLTFLRVTLTSLISGGFSMFLYSFLGAFLSLFIMKLFLTFYPKILSIIGISVIGGIANNWGQLLMASLIAQSKYILLYQPLLTIMGIIAGLIVGIISNSLLKYIQTFSLIEHALN